MAGLVRAVSPPVVVVLDGADHLAAALNHYERECRRNGGYLPSALLALRDALSSLATNGQERPRVVTGPRVVDDGVMTSTASPEPMVMNFEEVARTLRVSERSVRRLVSSGEIPTVRVGAAPRVRVEDVRQYVDRQRREQQQGAPA